MIRSELDVLLEKVQDSALRAELRSQVDRLQERRSFGLVFERHIPERMRLPQHAVRVGSQVVRRDDNESATFEVIEIADRVATLVLVRDAEGAYVERTEHGVGAPERAPLDSLVVISDFRDPVLPGLRHLESIERGGDKPYHVVIKGENHHSLEALRFTHAGKIDCIYIDPPYNSGARDWKYNNNYVDETDDYRHSKWLAFMERRLKLAEELLNPENSALIVTVDEKEYLRLGLLLQQTFADSTMQMVSTLINAKGTGRSNEFRRVNEYIYFLWFGNAKLGRFLSESEVLENDSTALVDIDDDTSDYDDITDRPVEDESDVSRDRGVDWQTFRRRDLASRRGTRKGGPRQFYPIYVNVATGQIDAVGDPLPHDVPRTQAPARDGCVAVFPIRKDGTEMNWAAVAPTFVERWTQGYARVGKATPEQPQQYIVQYLKSGSIRDVADGRAIITGHRPDGSVIARYVEDLDKTPTTQWAFPSHNAEHHGTGVLKALIPNRTFPFPKSLYAVEDALRLFVGNNPKAWVLDFFAGSGTTAHAVARLNKQDGGRRQSITVTNNEVSAEEATQLRGRGLRPGDSEWEALGIFEHITRPRVTAALTGRTPDGNSVAGDYRFTDEFPMADGFEENVAFFELRYLDADDVDLGVAFDDLAPMLWLRAGANGPIAARSDESGASRPSVWTDRYGVLFDEDRWRRFVSERPEQARAAFIVTYSPTAFAGITAELPPAMDVVRLPDTYVSMFLSDRGRA
jgi:adenine-specific DNA-methyltransferase